MTGIRRNDSVLMRGAGVLLLLLLLSGAILPEKGADRRITDNDDRIAYLRELGWEVEEKPVSAQYTTLPEEFPQVLLEYNELQRQQGYDLLPWAGKQVTIYIYKAVNEADSETVYCTLYVYNGRVIGGDAHSASLNGFMGALRPDSKNG